MNIFKSFSLAIKSILSSKARSVLTMLGIIIGVAAVIVIIGLGNGLKNYMTDSFSSMGTNLLTVSIYGRGSSRSISVDDMYELAEANPDFFSAVSPSVTLRATVKISNETLSSTSITGVGEDYAAMNYKNLSDGRFIQFADIPNFLNVCVVGSYISNTYFQGNAVGQKLKINGDEFKIVGVMEEIADSDEGSRDDVIYLPYSMAARLSSNSVISSYSFAMTSEDYVKESKDIIDQKLLSIFGNSNAYTITSMSELLDTMSSMIGMVVLILAAIAGISLVVGGIGIMNIMLVSVSERTREIGIRKALGARKRHILSQFVIEAGTTSGIGGLIGILIGILLSMAATQIISMALNESLVISPDAAAILLAFGISVGIGILFGYLPARKAARLNPIDALRYE